MLTLTSSSSLHGFTSLEWWQGIVTVKAWESLIPGNTDGQSLALTLFRFLFSIDFLSTAAGVEFSEWLSQEGEDNKESTS